jgi:hypothetical protein
MRNLKNCIAWIYGGGTGIGQADIRWYENNREMGT